MAGTHRRLRTASAAAALVVLGFGLGGCGGDGTIVTDDGTITVDQDGDGGKIEIESDEGSVTINGESGGELPEGWPSEVVVPDGGTVAGGMAMTGQGQEGWSASLTYPDRSSEELAADVRSGLESSGFELQGEFSSPEGAMSTYTGHGYAVTAMVGQDDSGATVVLTVGKEG